MQITLDSITKRYGKLTVLDQLSLTFPSGELTALLGPSGCGKTTILNIISGALQPDGGDVYFGEKRVTDVHLSRRNIGYVFQNYALYPNMTAYDNLKFPLTNAPLPGMSRAEKREHYHEQILRTAKLLKIEDTLSRYPSELSGGQQQRIALGRAMIRKPDILLMDEPFANLDRKLSIEMREEIRQLQQELKLTTVFVTHNQADANAISDRIVLMNEGKVQQAGTPSQLYDRPGNLFTADFFGEYGSNLLSREWAVSCCPELIRCWPKNSCTAICRPEDFSITDTTGPFTIKSCTRIGGSRLYQLCCGAQRVSVLSEEILPAETKVRLTLAQDRVCFYDNHGMLLDSGEV